MAGIRILVLENDDLWLRSLSKCFDELSTAEKPFDVRFLRTDGSFDQIVNEVETFNPHVSLAHNLYPFDYNATNGEKLRDYFADSGRKVACWFLDHPLFSGSLALRLDWMQGRYPPPSMRFFVVDRAFLSFFQERGLQADFLPLAVHRKMKEGTFSEAFRCDLNFVASPFFTQHVGHDMTQPAVLLELLSLHATQDFVDNCLVTTKQKLRDELKAPLESLFDDFKKYFTFQPKNHAEYAHLKSLFWAHVASRLPADFIAPREIHEMRLDGLFSFYQLTFLAQQLGTLPIDFRVYGAETWKKFVAKGAEHARRLRFEEVKSVFRSSTLSFCYTKWTFPTSVVERPLLVLESGGFPITDERPDLYEVFGLEGIATYRAFQEIPGLIDRWRSDEKGRLNTLESLRSRLREKHTYAHRVKALWQMLADWI